MRWGESRAFPAQMHELTFLRSGSMGKTIQTISLILSDFSPSDRKHTLVLAPTVAIIQWKNEIAKFTEGMKVVVFHGSDRIKNLNELMKHDIILTSCESISLLRCADLQLTPSLATLDQTPSSNPNSVARRRASRRRAIS